MNRGDAIKAALATREPSDSQMTAAFSEAVDLLLGFFDDVRRIADTVNREAANDERIDYDREGPR